MSKNTETGKNQSFENFIDSSKISPLSTHFCAAKTPKITKKKFQDTFGKMSNMRVIQKQLVYVIGLSANLAFKDTLLSRFEYFGQYGRITKLVVNKNKVYNMNGPNGPSYSAYITYSTAEECSLAILAMDNSVVDGHVLRASYGTTKYCANFLRGAECFNRECLYLHSCAEESDIIDRDDMNTNKSIFTSQHLLAMNIADIFNPEKRARLLLMRLNKTYFPSPNSIYTKDMVIDQLRRRGEDSASFSTNNSSLDNSQSSPVFRQRSCSRFNFTLPTLEDTVDIPQFVSVLIAKKCSRFSRISGNASFFKSYQNDDDLTYFDGNLIREYSENNPWARDIVGNCGNERILIQIEKLAEKEQMEILRKFNSA